MDEGTKRFGEALTRLEAELDWTLLGKLYCHEGGEQFFPPEQVLAMREAGLLIASRLGERLRPGGRSLYVGAAVGELVLLLCESLVFGREVFAINLPGPEAEEINRALSAVERDCNFSLPRIRFDALADVPGLFDHGWLVSVVNDPDAFPALHDELYGRRGDLATGRGELAEDRKRANALVDGWLQRLTTHALVTTTDEELPFVVPRAQALGLSIELEEGATLSAVVGDPIRLGALRRQP